MKEITDLTGMLDTVVEHTDGEKVSFDELLHLFGRRAFGPFMLLPGLLMVTPVGALPGMPLFTGSIIMLVALQLIIGRDSPWLPKGLLNFSFSREKLVKTADRAKPYTERIDRLIGPRLERFVSPLAQRCIAICCALMALMMLPLSLIPFAAAIPGASIVLLSLSIVAKDGLLAIIGLAVAVGAIFLFVDQSTELIQWSLSFLPG